MVVPSDGYCPECGSPMSLSSGPITPDPAVTTAPAATAAPGTAATAGMTACPVCGVPVRPGTEFCPNCGASLAAAARSTGLTAAAAPAAATPANAPSGPGSPAVCPRCGAAQRPNARFCKECGYRFGDKAAPAAPVTAAALKPGQVLAGRYRIVSVIGGGGMGAVYKAVDTHLKTREEPDGRPVAVKAILNTDDPDLLAAAAEEREMLIRLDHPNIVRIYDIVDEGGIPYIVMAYVQGMGWKQMYESNGGPLSEAEAVRLILGIRGAFEYLHHRKPPVVYRDFKPGNVIQVDDPSGEKRQVLIDLGTAIEYVPGQRQEAWGTEGYAPPEIGGICEQPPTMDLFTIASTLAALLGVDVAEQRILAPPHASWPVSDEIYDFVVRGRDPDPSVRFQTVDELFDQLEGINRFIQGEQRARVAGTPQLSGVSTSSLAQSLIPVQSTLFTGKLLSSTTGRITALPSLSTTDPAAPALQAARDLMAAGRYPEALTQIDAALRTNPASIDGHLLRAAALTNVGNATDAQVELDRAQRLSTPATRWRTLIVQAQAAEAQHDYATAEKQYQELTKLVPGEVLPKQALADIYRATGRYTAAAELYQRVVAADPANADAVLGWADSLVALNESDRAIAVLDAVNENAVRYVDAQLRLIELYVARIDTYLDQNAAALRSGRPAPPEMLHDLSLAARAIAGLADRTESRHYYRLAADWWYAAYRLARLKRLPANTEWPDGARHAADRPREIGHATREAYRRYLHRAPDSPDREDILARIYFDIDEWQ